MLQTRGGHGEGEGGGRVQQLIAYNIGEKDRMFNVHTYMLQVVLSCMYVHNVVSPIPPGPPPSLWGMC